MVVLQFVSFRSNLGAAGAPQSLVGPSKGDGRRATQILRHGTSCHGPLLLVCRRSMNLLLWASPILLGSRSPQPLQFLRHYAHAHALNPTP